MRNQISTLELRFYPEVADAFKSFARRRGQSPAWSRDGVWHKATLIFRNKTEQRRFVAAWGTASLT